MIKKWMNILRIIKIKALIIKDTLQLYLDFYLYLNLFYYIDKQEKQK